MGRTTNTQIPILIGDNYKNLMGHADLIEEGNVVQLFISITAEGTDAKDLVALMTSGEPQALKFVAIPVSPRTTKSKENM